MSEKYKISKSVVRDWVNKYSEECQYTPEKYSLKEMKKIKLFKKEMAELKKENEFLMHAMAFFAREID